MTDGTSPSVGRLLATARRARGLSLEDVSATTCIRTGLLRAIEADDFAPCGGTVYARGHVRSTAAVVGVDPAEAVALFDRLHAEGAEPHGARALEAHQPEVHRRQERTGPHWTAAMAVTTAVVTVLAVVAVVTPDDGAGMSGPDPAAAASRTATDGDAAAAPPTRAPTGAPAPPAAAPAPVTARPAGVVVRVRAVGAACWLRAQGTGGLLREETLAQGTVREYRDPQRVTLRLGNPGAVVLQVNGVTVRPPGDPRRPVTVAYGPGDPTVATG